MQISIYYAIQLASNNIKKYNILQTSMKTRLSLLTQHYLSHCRTMNKKHSNLKISKMNKSKNVFINISIKSS